MKTLEICTTPQKWIYFLEDFLAKTLAYQAKELEYMENAPDCGKKCIELYGKLNHDTLSLKTAQLSLFAEWNTSYATFRKVGIMQNGSVYQIVNSDIHTKEKEYTLLLTPTATDGGSTYRDMKKLKVYLEKHQHRLIYQLQLKGFTNSQILSTYELMMGYPIGYTELRC